MICIGCGCDEDHACTLPGGAACAWIHAGAQGLAGICTACIELYPPSSIDPELNHAEASIAIAISDDEDAEPPAISFLEPRTESSLDTLRRAFDETPRLILPGDEEFHL